MLVCIPIKVIVFFKRFFDLELLFWGNVVIGCCLCNRLFGNLPGCSIIIFLTSWVVVETQKHAHLLTGQNLVDIVKHTVIVILIWVHGSLWDYT